MQVDFKVKAWERLRIPDEMEQEIKDLVASKGITCSQDLYDIYPDTDFYWEFVVGSETQMTVEDNEGAPTIEIIER